MKRTAVASPLRNPAFQRLWLGLSISYLGDQFTIIALLWFVLQLTLCAALVLAGRKTSTTWRNQSVRVMSPINVRAHLGAGEASGLYLAGGGFFSAW